ncbi:MAG: Rab family GTPase [Promethearchaeota archaeon]|jgi:small GTP-binding protein
MQPQNNTDKKTTIQINQNTRNLLRQIGKKSATYDDIILKLITDKLLSEYSTWLHNQEKVNVENFHKVVVIGDGGVGKTSLIQRYIKGSSNNEYTKTLGARFTRFEQIVGDYKDIRARIVFWDPAGQKEFSLMRPTFYNGAKGAIVVFDLSRPETLDSVMDWYKDLNKFCGTLPTVLFGSKLDKIANPEEYNKDKVKEIKDKEGFLDFYLTSAKTGENVIDAFSSIIKIIVNQSI